MQGGTLTLLDYSRRSKRFRRSRRRLTMVLTLAPFAVIAGAVVAIYLGAGA